MGYGRCQMQPSPRFACFFVAVLAACGGGNGTPTPDAAVTPDAPASLTGLGQACSLAQQGNDCPAPLGCLGFEGNPTTGICTPPCVEGGTMTTDAQGNLAITPDPLASGPTTTCTAAFSETVGVPACISVVLWSPMEDLVVGKTYTDVTVVCAIVCSANNTCPGSLHCNAVNHQCET